MLFTRGSSGQYVERMLAKFGVAAGIASKIVRADDGEGLIARMIEGKGNEIGFGAITEIRQFEPKGITLVAPLPDAVQNFTVYEAAVMNASRTPGSAARFVDFVNTAEARTVSQPLVCKRLSSSTNLRVSQTLFARKPPARAFRSAQTPPQSTIHGPLDIRGAKKIALC